MLAGVYLVNYQDDRLVRPSQHSRQILVDRREALFRVDHEKKKIARPQCVFGGALYLPGQFRFARAKNPAGVPQGERMVATSAGSRKPVPRNSGLIMNNGNLSADQAIEQRRLA